VSLPELREECARVRAAADPDPQARNRRLHAARRLRRYTDPDGAWTLIAKGTPQAGAAVNAALDPIVDRLATAARLAGRPEPVEAYAFDALLQLATQATSGPTAAPTPSDRTDGPPADENDRSAGGGAPRGAGTDRAPAPTAPDRTQPHPVTPEPTPARRGRTNPRYLALLRIDLQALRRGHVAGDELCEITGIGPIPVPVARDLLGDAILHLVITRGVDVAHVTHLGRGPTAAQKIALAWTSPGCTVQGCPRTRIQYDHREDYARTRHTRLDELDPLCGHHHDLKTRHNWALVPGTGKRPIVAPTDPRHPRHQQNHATPAAPAAAPHPNGRATAPRGSSALDTSAAQAPLPDLADAAPRAP
jgi:hypothetical protein